MSEIIECGIIECGVIECDPCAGSVCGRPSEKKMINKWETYMPVALHRTYDRLVRQPLRLATTQLDAYPFESLFDALREKELVRQLEPAQRSASCPPSQPDVPPFHPPALYLIPCGFLCCRTPYPADPCNSRIPTPRASPRLAHPHALRIPTPRR